MRRHGDPTGIVADQGEVNEQDFAELLDDYLQPPARVYVGRACLGGWHSGSGLHGGTVLQCLFSLAAPRQLEANRDLLSVLDTMFHESGQPLSKADGSRCLAQSHASLARTLEAALASWPGPCMFFFHYSTACQWTAYLRSVACGSHQVHCSSRSLGEPGCPAGLPSNWCGARAWATPASVTLA